MVSDLCNTMNIVALHHYSFENYSLRSLIHYEVFQYAYLTDFINNCSHFSCRESHNNTIGRGENEDGEATQSYQ